MQTEFIVEAIERKYGFIKLEVRKYFPPKPPEIEEERPSMLDPLETFVPTTEEEKFTVKLLKTFRKLGLDPFPSQHVSYPSPTRCVPVIESRISLTDEEYEAVGNPSLGQKLTMELKKSSTP